MEGRAQETSMISPNILFRNSLRKVRKAVLHSGYNPETYHNDLAMIQVSLASRWAVTTVCLPTRWPVLAYHTLAYLLCFDCL